MRLLANNYFVIKLLTIYLSDKDKYFVGEMMQLQLIIVGTLDLLID